MFNLPRAVSKVFGETLNKDGSLVRCEPENILAIRSWYEQTHRLLPKGSIVVVSTTAHSWPYPALLYKRGVWAAIDLYFSIQDIPMTLIGETEGHVYRPHTLNVYESTRKGSKFTSNDRNLEELDRINSGLFKFEKGPAAEIKGGYSLSNMSEGNLKSAEERLRWEIGPDVGFDLQQIWKHYQHRMQLRKQFRPLRRGEFVPVAA